jgi:hypothetical protein
VNKFFEEEADVGNESDDENINHAKNAQDAYYKDSELRKKNKGLDIDKLNNMELKYQKREQERQRREEMRQGKIPQDDEDDFIEHSDDDALRSNRASLEDDRYSQDGDEQAAKLPSVSDPKLWRVRVKKGWERTAAMALMNK